jgi:F-type H+-transporting ATPase subunit epsilon
LPAVAGEVTDLQVTASDGLMGIWANHAPLISMLATGELHCTTSQGEKKNLAVGEGFIEVLQNDVKVLCDFAEFDEEIDIERAEKALERARERLKHRTDPDVDDIRAEAALRRAIVRLKLGGKH